MNRLIAAAVATVLLGVTACDPKVAYNNLISSGRDIGGNAKDIGINAGQHTVKAGQHIATAETLGEKDEDDLGQSVGVALTNEYQVIQNDDLIRYVSLVGLAVASTSPRPDIQYVFGVLDSDQVNAFSGPNGYVFVTRGALAHMQDEAELAGVLAHEMSHVILHHGLHQVQTAERGAAVSELAQGVPASEQFSAFADKAIESIVNGGYSQPQEYEADQSGAQLAAQAGYDPASYLHFLQRLAHLQKTDTKAMSTHPGAASRVEKVSDQLNSLPKGGATLADRFKQNVKF